MLKALALLGFLGVLLALYLSDILYSVQTILDSRKHGNVVLFTSEELAIFDGTEIPVLYLSVLGTVFNVTKGSKHYGIGKQYHFFVGKDASRNFVTGNFEDGAESDDLTGLSKQELRSLNSWFKFYRKEYQKVGKLIGRYYDELGTLTPYARQIKKLIREAEQDEKNNELEKQKFPPCNIEWDAERGSRVWCTDRSGGVTRSWVGKPRQLYEAGGKTFRCACIAEDNESLGTVKEYPGCDRNSDSCFVKN